MPCEPPAAPAARVGDNAALDHSGKHQQGWGHAVFGEVVEGREVVDVIEQVATGASAGQQDVPTDDVVIVSAEVLAWIPSGRPCAESADKGGRGVALALDWILGFSPWTDPRPAPWPANRANPAAVPLRTTRASHFCSPRRGLVPAMAVGDP